MMCRCFLVQVSHATSFRLPITLPFHAVQTVWKAASAKCGTAVLGSYVTVLALVTYVGVIDVFTLQRVPIADVASLSRIPCTSAPCRKMEKMGKGEAAEVVACEPRTPILFNAATRKLRQARLHARVPLRVSGNAIDHERMSCKKCMHEWNSSGPEARRRPQRTMCSCEGSHQGCVSEGWCRFDRGLLTA